MKKFITAFIALSLLCFSQSISYGIDTQGNGNFMIQNTIDIIDVMNNPDHYENYEVIVFESVQAYIDAVAQDSNLTSEEKSQMISDAMSTPYSAYISYLTFKEKVTVSSSYSCYPYFYASCEFLGLSPNRILEIKNANIDRTHSGKSKQFSGDLYYNLESDTQLYWDLNGDFYDNGTTTSSGGINIGISESTEVSFSVSYGSNHRKYIHKTGYVKI